MSPERTVRPPDGVEIGVQPVSRADAVGVVHRLTAAPTLSDDELNDLARRIVGGEVYLAADGPSLKNAFGAILQMSADLVEDGFAETVGAVYEDISKRLPLGLNGYPIFFSCKFLHTDQREKLADLIDKKEAALNGP